MIRLVIDGLGELLPQVAFVGGAATCFYLSESSNIEVRITDDIDCAIEVSGIIAQSALEGKLRQRGFINDISAGSPTCRWIYKGIKVDIIATTANDTLAGFSNRWYLQGLKDKRPVEFGSVVLYVFPIMHFLATKLEAFKNRGNNDFYGSRDWEDIVLVLAEGEGIETEYLSTPRDIQLFLAENARTLLKNKGLLEFIICHLDRDGHEDARAGRVISHLTFFASQAT